MKPGTVIAITVFIYFAISSIFAKASENHCRRRRPPPPQGKKLWLYRNCAPEA
jgi:hypothetical protein